MFAGVTPDRHEPGTGSLRGPVVALCLVVVGLLAWAVAARNLVVWHDEQRTASRDLQTVERERDELGTTTPALDAAADDAIDRALDDDLLVVGAIVFGAGSLALGAGVGSALGRVRRRQARVALHPSLVAAADRKLERLLAEHAQDLVTMLDDHGRFTYVSPSVSTILGYDPAGLIGKRFDAYLEATTLDTAAGDRRAGDPLRHRARHADGSVRWMETLSHRIEDDRAVGVVTLYSSRDVTERVHLEETLAAERRLLGDTLANIHAGILSVDLDGRVIDANAEFCAMVGFRPPNGASIVDVESRYGMLDADGDEVPVDDRPLLRATTLGESVKQFAATLVAADGTRCEVMATAGPLRGSDGLRNGAVLTVHDVSELRAAEAELRSLATVDMLTGLPNRRHLVAALSEAMERNADTPERIALLFMDLDGFKRVNDTYGHDAGDEVLKLVGARIVSCLRGNDIVARMGGDEFVVVVEHLNAPADILPLVDRIERVLSEPFELLVDPLATDRGDGVGGPVEDALVDRAGGEPGGAGLHRATITIGASVGVALGSHVTGAADLLARADAAMYERKRERTGDERHEADSTAIRREPAADPAVVGPARFSGPG